MFNVFLPVAGVSINAFLILGMGGLVGFLSGLFGVGGGFLLTPLLMMVGISPAVAAASDSNQIVAASSSGALGHFRLGNVDMKMGMVILLGGLSGGTVGVQAVKVLRQMGNFDFTIKAVYVLVLGLVGGAMFIESLNALRRSKSAVAAKDITAAVPTTSGLTNLFHRLPFQTEFASSGLRTSLLFPFGIGLIVGFLAAIMGVGGGFIMVPAMIYIIGMPTVMAIGTDLFQIVLTSANVTLQQAITNHTVDIVLALLLLCGSVLGAQVGVRMTKKLKGEQIRILLAIIVLVVMVKLLIDLLSAPGNIIDYVTAKGGH
ncbi:MAG: sulfite exporter TauE/SafE family protein [Pseudomonadota bacterium]